jgi:hypothetical protein
MGAYLSAWAKRDPGRTINVAAPALAAFFLHPLSGLKQGLGDAMIHAIPSLILWVTAKDDEKPPILVNNGIGRSKKK